MMVGGVVSAPFVAHGVVVQPLLYSFSSRVVATLAHSFSLPLYESVGFLFVLNRCWTFALSVEAVYEFVRSVLEAGSLGSKGDSFVCPQRLCFIFKSLYVSLYEVDCSRFTTFLLRVESMSLFINWEKGLTLLLLDECFVKALSKAMVTRGELRICFRYASPSFSASFGLGPIKFSPLLPSRPVEPVPLFAIPNSSSSESRPIEVEEGVQQVEPHAAADEELRVRHDCFAIGIFAFPRDTLFNGFASP